MKKYLKISLILVIILISYLIYAIANRKNDTSLAYYIGPLLPKKVKIYLKNNFLLFEKIDDQKTEINKQKQIINKFSLSTEGKFRNNNLKILFNKIGEDEIFEINKNKYIFSKFSTTSIITGKWEPTGGSFYLENFKNNIIVVSATGIIAYNNINFFKNNFFNFTSIKSNIVDLIKDPKFFTHSPFGIKDILIKDNYLYVSYTYQAEENCYNTSILRSKINFKKLIFEDFFKPSDCVKIDNTYGNFSAHQSGGRMKSYDDHSIIFTVGDYGFRDHSQNLDQTTFGKTILISSKGFVQEVLSIGHRNHQGLYHDKESNKIYMTEHGPKGGDEININDLNQKKIKNYGWPISSYGEHYGFKTRDEKHPYYVQAPLYKSHLEHGFIEPHKYFTPSIGISEIVKINPNFFDRNYYLVFGALGNNIEEGDMSIHFLKLDEADKILDHEIFKVNERVRDILKFKEKNMLFLALESTSSIGIIKEFKD